MARVGECERELSKHLPTTKSGGILRLCYRRNHYGYALAEGVEECIVGSGGRQWVGGCDWMRREARTGLFLSYALSATFWERVEG